MRRSGGAAAAARGGGQRAARALPLPDGRWLLLSIASDEWRWDKFKACLADPALNDPRYADVASREQNARALVRELDRIFATRDLAHWRRVLDEAGLIFGIVAETQISRATSRCWRPGISCLSRRPGT